MRFEDLGLTNTFACLHHQKPFWLLPVVLFSTDRAPPLGKLLYCVHKHDIATPPCPSRWRDDASQIICDSYYDCNDDAQHFCFILCHLLESFFYSVKSPFRDFHLLSESDFVFFPTLHFSGRESPASSYCARIRNGSKRHG